MAEIRKIICDVCKQDIENGYVVRPSARRRIRHGTATTENYRFDICDRCFGKLQELCGGKDKPE